MSFLKAARKTDRQLKQMPLADSRYEQKQSEYKYIEINYLIAHLVSTVHIQ